MLKQLAFLIIKIIFKQEEETMAMIYATLITKGVKQFKDVPRILKDKVRQILIDLDLAELAVEDAAIATDSNAKKEDE